jgi:uncharacterized protein (DUF1800 family)
MLPEIAVLRFGLGARPGELRDAAHDPRAWLRAQITGPVALSAPANLAPSDEILKDFLAAREERKQAKGTGNEADLLKSFKDSYLPHYRAQVLARTQSAACTQRPFAERLVHFWTNHFAVSADKGIVTGIAGTLENEAIRPHVNGYFADLLLAVERHPAMIAFLDNQASVGPASRAARFMSRRDSARRLGINENLGREILELHTVGVGGGYSQTDVTGFAKVLTGWSIGGARGRARGGDPGHFYFRDNVHEPGSQTVLGRRFDQGGQEQGEAVLRMLAQHPATARFLAHKLARHFVADDPPPALVDRLARAYQHSDGHLPAVYAALIDDELAWSPQALKFKTPQELVFSTLRALDVQPQEPQEALRNFEFLGQRQYTPGSPAGWPDTAQGWDGSDALMHRVLWAARVGDRFETGREPVALCRESLGSFARPDTITALQRAASGSQALALLIMSPEFQRR